MPLPLSVAPAFDDLVNLRSRRRIVAVHTRAETLGPVLARLGLAEPPAAIGASRAPPAAAG